MTRKVWIGGALLLVLAGMGVVVVGVRTRSSGQDRLRDVLAQQASGGYGNSFDDLVKAAPQVDPTRQQRAWDWMQVRAKLPLSYAKPLDEAWYFARAAHPPIEDRTWAEAMRPVMEDLRSILVDGPVCFTSLGWIRQDAKRLASSQVSSRQLRSAHILRLREAHRWFALEAMTAPDPAATLDALDALAASLSRPGCLTDAMIVGACASMRDRAFARLAVRGDLSPDRLASWVAEPAKGTSWVADAWRGERLRYWAPLAQDLLAGSGMGDHFDGEGGLSAWLRGASDCALFLKFLAANEGHVRGTVDVETLRRATVHVQDLGTPYESALGMRTAMYTVGVRWRAAHRLIRLGTLVALASSQSTEALNTEAEARQSMGIHAARMDAGTWDVALTYERLGPKRFRIAVDPKSAVPSVLAGTGEATQVRQSPFGGAASKRTLHVSPGGFEFQVR